MVWSDADGAAVEDDDDREPLRRSNIDENAPPGPFMGDGNNFSTILRLKLRRLSSLPADDREALECADP